MLHVTGLCKWMPGPAAASFAFFGLLTYMYIYWRKMVQWTFLIMWSLRMFYGLFETLDTLNTDRVKKKWRHLFLWWQLIYAQNFNYFFFGRGKCLVWQSLQSEHRLSIWTQWRHRMLGGLYPCSQWKISSWRVSKSLNINFFFLLSISGPNDFW